MSHDYDREDIEIEIEMNNEMIQRLENRLNKSHELEESEEPEILRQLQELKDANEELMQLIDEEFGELEDLMDADPEFKKIYEKQQKGLQEIEDEINAPEKDEDWPDELDEETERIGSNAPLIGKVVSKKFAEEDSGVYKPSVSYNPLIEAIKGNHQDWEGANRGDYEAMLSDIKEFVDRFDLLLKSDTPESKEKARKLYGILREYTLSEKFPWALAVKKFPILNDVPVLSFAEDRGILDSQKKYRVDKTLERIQSLLKQQGLSSEQKKELKNKESALKEMSAKLVEFAEMSPETKRGMDDYYAGKKKAIDVHPQKEKMPVRIPKRIMTSLDANQLKTLSQEIGRLFKAVDDWKNDNLVKKYAKIAIEHHSMTPAELARAVPLLKDFQLVSGKHLFAEFEGKRAISRGAKKEGKPLKEYSNQALRTTLMHLENALENWKQDKRGKVENYIQTLLELGFKSNEIENLSPSVKAYMNTRGFNFSEFDESELTPEKQLANLIEEKHSLLKLLQEEESKEEPNITEINFTKWEIKDISNKIASILNKQSIPSKPDLSKKKLPFNASKEKVWEEFRKFIHVEPSLQDVSSEELKKAFLKWKDENVEQASQKIVPSQIKRDPVKETPKSGLESRIEKEINSSSVDKALEDALQKKRKIRMDELLKNQ